MRTKIIGGLPHHLEGDCWVVDRQSEIYQTYKRGSQHQLEQWLAGNPIHHKWGDSRECEECCPDFSCCDKSLMWDEKTRRAFVEHPELRDEMCMMAIAGLLNKDDLLKDVEIVGLTRPNETVN